MRARHTRFNRLATTIVASVGFLSTASLGGVLVLNNAGIISIRDENTHYYTARFMVDGALVYENTYKKGDSVEYVYGNMPTKSPDVDGQLYAFIGWDTTGDGFIDILPDRIYSNYTARAVFAKYGIPDIDWTKVDFNKLLDLLTSLDIDLESFMNFFGLTWEDMLELLKINVFTYTTDYSGPTYFRNESFGDYDMAHHKWIDGNYYDASKISEGSVNPLQFAIDKASRYLGDQANQTFDMTFAKGGKKYPVVLYEKENNQHLNSESYSLANVEDNHYVSTGLPYSYANNKIITALQLLNFSNDQIKKDEEVYRKYVYEHYLNLDPNMKEFILNLIGEYGIKRESMFNYSFVDSINSFFGKNYTFKFQMKSYPTNVDPIMYFLGEAKEGLGRHFAGATTLIYRALGVPARYVQGYVNISKPGEENVVTAIQAHSWVEIYIDGVGWLATDSCINSLGEFDMSHLFGDDDPYSYDFESEIESPLKDVVVNFDMEQYAGVSLKDGVYQIPKGMELNKEDFSFTAKYENGRTKPVEPTLIRVPNTNTVGNKEIIAVYTEGDEVVTKRIPVNVYPTEMNIFYSFSNFATTATYNGSAPFSEAIIKNSLKFYTYEEDEETGSSGLKEYSLPDGFEAHVTCEILNGTRFGETFKPNSLSDFVDVGTCNVQVSVHITDGEGVIDEDYITAKKDDQTNFFLFSISPLTVAIPTMSGEHRYEPSSTETMNWPGFGVDEDDPITIIKIPGTENFIIKSDDIKGWKTVPVNVVGTYENTFNINTVKVINSQNMLIDTRNFQFTIDPGTITIYE